MVQLRQSPKQVELLFSYILLNLVTVKVGRHNIIKHLDVVIPTPFPNGLKNKG